VTTSNLKWEAKLRPLKAGGPDVFTISTRTQTIQFTNVLVGEVWVCSGQSNMEFPLKNSFQADGDIAAATNTQIRLFKVGKNRMESPTTRIKSAWETLTPQNAAGFSAVGYYFGRDLQKARNVPVGLIGTYWGGTPAESWMDRASLELNPRYQAEILDTAAAANKAWLQAVETYAKEKADAQKEGKRFTKTAPRQPWIGYELYNGMVAPLVPYAIKGAIWYQGESNASRAEQYRTLFPDMIRCWRRNWNEPDFPFLCVQLAPFKAIQAEPGESDWAELREAQLLATQVLPKVGMAVITDVGEEKDIHPRKKEPVGARLALAARAIAYREKIEYSGPIYKSLKINGERAVLSFDHVGRGLEVRGEELKGFAICGEDRKWVWAKAEIQPDNTIVVRSPEVARPVAVRYGWADYPVVNLWNRNGLPAAPFRTDDFPLITASKK
ncbi:MAG TPA: sialate O-acetylesterase, partial [Candidatus Sulfotelmatobacter sp.]|nr:sialate O-acetylesterase [Candidatus Sulfotelmatobacter sp.]